MTLICKSLIVLWYLLWTWVSHFLLLRLVFPRLLDFWIPSLPHSSCLRLYFFQSHHFSFRETPPLLVWSHSGMKFPPGVPTGSGARNPSTFDFFLSHYLITSHVEIEPKAKKLYHAVSLVMPLIWGHHLLQSFNFHFWLLGNIYKFCPPSWGRSCFLPFSETIMVERMYKSWIGENEFKIHL